MSTVHDCTLVDLRINENLTVQSSEVTKQTQKGEVHLWRANTAFTDTKRKTSKLHICSF